ncbi:MAG: hypothetical protein R3308_06670 [Thiohalobacterales bacterium]|nr:hypothetical protein [Thiohalobacterales bacterium]
MIPAAYVLHEIRGRVRLRVREKCKDPMYFEEARRRLTELPGIDEVRINCNNGTILLLHTDESLERLESRLRPLGLFDLNRGPEPVKPALAQLSSGIAMVDAAVQESSGGRVDLRTLAYIAMMGFTLHQIVRGNLLGPAIPMMGQALTLLDRINGRQGADGSPVFGGGGSGVDSAGGDGGD